MFESLGKLCLLPRVRKGDRGSLDFSPGIQLAAHSDGRDRALQVSSPRQSEVATVCRLTMSWSFGLAAFRDGAHLLVVNVEVLQSAGLIPLLRTARTGKNRVVLKVVSFIVHSIGRALNPA